MWDYQKRFGIAPSSLCSLGANNFANAVWWENWPLLLCRFDFRFNMNSFRFKASQMATKCVANTEFTWTWYVHRWKYLWGPNLAKYKLSNISLRVNAQPTSATKIKLTFEVAPWALASLKNIADYNNNGFPTIEIITTSVDIFPVEDDEDHHHRLQTFCTRHEEIRSWAVRADILRDGKKLLKIL